MSAVLPTISGLSNDAQKIYRSTVADLNTSLRRTTQELAERREDKYFSPRSFSDRVGLINIYYNFLLVQQFAALPFSQCNVKVASQVEKDIALLENIRKSAKSDTSEQLSRTVQAAIDVGISNEQLQTLFNASTWNLIFPVQADEQNAVKAILEAIGALPVNEKKRKADSEVPSSPAPIPVQVVKKAKVETEEDEKLARIFQDEEFARSFAVEPNDISSDRELAKMMQLAADTADDAQVALALQAADEGADDDVNAAAIRQLLAE